MCSKRSLGSSVAPTAAATSPVWIQHSASRVVASVRTESCPATQSTRWCGSAAASALAVRPSRSATASSSSSGGSPRSWATIASAPASTSACGASPSVEARRAARRSGPARCRAPSRPSAPGGARRRRRSTPRTAWAAAIPVVERREQRVELRVLLGQRGEVRLHRPLRVSSSSTSSASAVPSMTTRASRPAIRSTWSSAGVMADSTCSVISRWRAASSENRSASLRCSSAHEATASMSSCCSSSMARIGETQRVESSTVRSPHRAIGSANGAAAGVLVRFSAIDRAAPVSWAPSSCIRRKASAPLNGAAAGSLSRSAMS